MANYIVCLVIQRLILPLILASCVLFRPVGLSLPYLWFLFYLPHIPVATKKSMRGHTGYFLKFLIVISVLILAAPISFQILLAVLGNDFIKKCEFLEILLRHVGVVRYDDLSIPMILLWSYPEVTMFLASIIIFVLLKKFSAESEVNNEIFLATVQLQAISVESGDATTQTGADTHVLKHVARVLSVIALCVTGSLQPSVISLVYFIVFLGAATWYACNKELERAYAIVLRITLIFLMVHITALLAYQTPWPQDFFPVNTTIPRLLGFTPLVMSGCELSFGNITGNDIRIIEYNLDLNLDYYLLPVVLIVCYYILTISAKEIVSKIESKKLDDIGELESGHKPIATVTKPSAVSVKAAIAAKKLLDAKVAADAKAAEAAGEKPLSTRQVSFRMHRKNLLRKTLSSSRWRGAAMKVKDILNAPSGSGTDSETSPLMRSKSLRSKKDPVDNETEDENTEVEPTEPKEEKPKLLKRVADAAVNTAKFIYKNSYIFTNMTMMMWSIIYHSWIGFVFLIWSNVIWIVPNQRKNMLKCMPYIVFYAECLLLAQFLFGMQLTEDELPSSVLIKGVNILDQLGFRKQTEYAYRPLLLKSAFTIMFWASCRQYMTEREIEKGQSALGNMMVNQQITVAMVKPITKKGVLERIAILVNAILVRFWIWAVALTLFISGFSGSKMTVFRILYMTLFLIFVLYFQFSWRLWRKTMYAFWLVVIVYSMIILILVYIYQFKQFPEFCVEYLLIPLDIQKDIGLEVYETKQLLLHLIKPTAVVIITVVQLHYCHTKFLEWSEIPPRSEHEGTENPLSETSSAFGQFSAPKSENGTTDNDTSELLDDIKFRKFSKKEIMAFLQKLKQKLINLIEFTLVVIEMHALKGILIYAFYIGVRRVNVIHISFVILCVYGVRLKTEGQIYVTKLISLISSIILIITMVYQVEYIDKRNYETDCGINSTDTKYLNNTAEWFGLDKQNKETKLMGLIKYYFLYIVIVSFHTVLIVRQTIKRIRAGISPRTPLVLFPNVIRRDADKDLPHLLMYLANYTFYKFGVEICLVGMVTVVATRMDFFACFYAIWLCKLYNLSRAETMEKWVKLKKFIISIIPIQYILLVGLPPLLCVDYYWNIPFLEDFRQWAMLPENTNEFRNLHWGKLIVDFILLLLICRQTLVFRIEERYKDNDDNFPGGTNKSVLQDIDQMGIVPFDNPTPDYIERIRNWLDIAKRGFFMIFFWVTLCIVFITGSSRVNLFSVGYLIGAFTFLWEGTDFYLRPIDVIIKRWNYLIGYNCIAIACKASLQMFGCLLLGILSQHACFLVQLFGISCVCNPDKPHDDECTVPVHESRLFLDGLCFAILLLQRRVFSSYYFCHMINETKASAILASRGAELLDELARKDVKLEQEREQKVLQKIKSKMDRIKATQQKILESVQSQRTHHEGVSMSHRRPSMSSCAGYHTPIEDEVAASVMVEGEVSDFPSDINGRGGLPSRSGSYFPNQAPSPCSAILTISEGYLEPFEISYSMPPDSELVRTISPEETFPVFSPPPYDNFPTPSFSQIPTMQTLTAGNLTPANNGVLATTTELTSRRHRRQSSLNTVSWQQDHRELTVETSTRRRKSSTNILPVPNNLAPEATPEECHSQVSKPRTPRPQRRQSRRLSNVAMEELTADVYRRRPSYAPSWAEDDDEMSHRSHRRRNSSWGPVGEIAYVNSLYLVPPRSPTSHHQSIRSGDYYMFEEVEDEFELDIIDDNVEEEEERQGTTRRRLSKKTSLGQLLAQMKEASEKEREAEAQRQLALRRASAPNFGIEKSISAAHDKTVHSEPIRPTNYDQKSKKRTKSVDDASKPGTSKDSRDTSPGSDDDQEGLIDGPPPGPTLMQKIVKLLKMGPAFLSAGLVSLTIRLHRLSKSYRYVMKTLAKEKKALKEQEGFGAGRRTGPNQLWTPISSNVRASRSHSSSDAEGDENVDNKSIGSIESDTQSCSELRNIDVAEHTPAVTPHTQRKGILAGTLATLAPPKSGNLIEPRKGSIVPSIRIVAPSIERGLDVMSPLNRSADHLDRKDEDRVVEFDEPPKPKKAFEDDPDFASFEHKILTELLQSCYYAILAHTDLICYTMVFVNQINSSSILSLPLPLMVLLWGTLTFPRPSKTFWVTLIAYTQVIVIIKCVCQYEVLWWNQGVIPSNKPFAPPRILGIERKQGYADYDLALLLFVFCHRFILKSLGLWKSDAVEEALDDGAYTVESTDMATKGLLDTANDEEMQGIEHLIEQFLMNLDESSADGRSGETIEEDIYVNMVQGGMVKHRFQTTIKISNTSEMIMKIGSKNFFTWNKSSFYVFLKDERKVLRHAIVEVEKLENGRKLQKIMQDDLKINLKKVDSETIIAEQPKNLVYVEKTPEITANFFPSVIKLSLIKYSSSVKDFVDQLVDNRDRKTTDVYKFLFICDFVNFFVIIFGFSAFGTQEGDGGVMSYLEENKVPLPFLLMLIIQFLLIIIDRAIYLRKQTVAKIVFQLLLACGIHIWMFFVLPATTERTFNATGPPILYYLIKCYYFLLSAHQIRSGYPQRILGNFLTKGFGLINSGCYKIYMNIPFLFELRTLMDWIFTDTSMTLMDWLKMEDIFTNIYSLKCGRTMETDSPAPSGQKKKDMPKYIMGGFCLVLIIAAIWFPLALFAFSSAVGEPNIPHYFQVDLRIGTYDQVYFSGAQNHDIQPLTGQWSKFVSPYAKDKEAMGFLGVYEDIDVAAIRIGTNSSKLWNISPPDRLRFLQHLTEGHTITCRLSYTLHRKSFSTESPAEITETKDIQILKDDPARASLIKLLHNQTDTTLHLPFMLPKFLKVRGNGFLKPIHPLTGGLESDDDEENYRNVSLRLHSTEPENLNETSPTIQFWWEVKEDCFDTNYNKKFKDMPFNDCNEHMVIYLFNDKLFPSTLSSLAAGGIVGIYSTFILFFWRFLRGSIFSGSSAKIMFEDFPYVDRLLQLCLDIYLVRETMEFGLEEDLFAKLIFLYRSPETMIKWTRPKSDGGDDDEETSRSTSSKKGVAEKKRD